MLVRGLRHDETHFGPLCRHHDRLGVGGVVLLALHKGLHVLRCDEPHVMPERGHLPRPVVRARKGFEHHHAGPAAP